MPRHLLCFFSLTAFLSSPVYSSEYELGMYIGRYHFSNPNDDIQHISDTFKKPINLSINIGKYYPINNQQKLSIYGLFDYTDNEETLSTASYSISDRKEMSILGLGSAYRYQLFESWYVKGALEMGYYNDKVTFKETGEETLSKSNSGLAYAFGISTGYQLSQRWSLEGGVKYIKLDENKYGGFDFSKASNTYFGAVFSF